MTRPAIVPSHYSSALGPLMLVVGIVYYFLVQYIVALAWPVPLSLKQNFISDLGNTVCAIQQTKYICSPLHGLMNLSFIIIGLALGIGALLTCAQFPHSRAAIRALTLIGIAGIGTIFIGLLPENIAHIPHTLVAIISLVTLNLGVAGFYWSSTLSRPWRLYALVSGGCGLAALLMLILGVRTVLGLGGIERIADYVPDLWILGFGLHRLSRLNVQSS